ncbi:MAG TPA: hypothetical protein VJU81_14005 [Methylomirabilota bacterium]|nr:hypothetical protein [Methylomirabilota bacterium]
MSASNIRHVFVPSLASAVAALTLGGCIYSSKETTREVPTTTTPVVVSQTVPPDRVITYPEGRYQLYGDGRSVPYYWVWIPSGSAPPTPPPPPRVP